MARLPDQLFRALVVVFPFLAATAVQPRITGVALVVGNLLPLLGALFFGWSFSEILWLYWLESAIIGVFTIPKMLIPAWAGSERESLPLSVGMAAFMTAFFCAHYGGFMFGHGVFLYVYSAITGAMQGNIAPTDDPQSVFVNWFAVTFIGAAPFSNPLFWSALMLLTSHAVSFKVHYLGQREYLRLDFMEAMFLPYKRIWLMHITILAGAVVIAIALLFLPQWIGAALAGFFVGVKIFVDLRAHHKEHAASLAS